MRALRGLRSGAVRCKARPPCKQRSGERARLQIGRAEHGELLTQNILRMLVTRDVSKLSCWLNFFACCVCRGSQTGQTLRAAGRAERAEKRGGARPHGASSVRERA